MKLLAWVIWKGVTKELSTKWRNIVLFNYKPNDVLYYIVGFKNPTVNDYKKETIFWRLIDIVLLIIFALTFAITAVALFFTKFSYDVIYGFNIFLAVYFLLAFIFTARCVQWMILNIRTKIIPRRK